MLKKLLKFTGLMFLATLLLYPARYLNSTIFYIFQERDISRALELISGHPIFYGPELTGGGNLPGPFYYFLLSPPLWLGLGWIGVWNWMFVLLSLGGVLGWHYLQKKFNSMTALLWLILYSGPLSAGQLINLFVNPSFSIVFIILINILILKAFSEKNINDRNRAFLLACFVTGLATQLHYSIVVYIFALLFLRIFATRMKLLNVEKKYFLYGLGSFLLTLAPYLTWCLFRLFGLELGQELWKGGIVGNALPSLFMHFGKALEIPAADFWLAGFWKLFLVTPVVLVILLVVRAFTAKPDTQTGESAKDNSLLKILSVCLAFTFVPFSFYFFVPQGSRYGAPLTATFGFMMAIMFSRYLVSKNAIRYFNSIAAFFLAGVGIRFFVMNQEAVGEADLKTFFIIGIFSISALLFWLKSHKQQRGLVLSFVLSVCLIFSQVLIQNNVRRGMRFNSKLPQYWHWQKILSKIYNETGWTYGDIAERVYYINHHFEQAPRLAFDMFGKENQRFAKNPKLTPDGYMVSIVDPKEPKNLEWMLKQGLHDDIRAGLQSGDIILGEYDPNESVLIAPYYVKNKQNLPQFFSNQGLGYTHLPEEALLRSLDFAAGVKIVDKNNFIFKWNDCPDHHYYCDTGVIAKITKNRPGVYEIDLKIIGMSLSQGSKWISPDWTQSWINPYVELTCDNKTTRMRIISSVGYNQKYLTPVSNPIYKLSNNSILAPLYRHFDFKCSGELAELSVGRESSEVERISEFVKFPEARLSVRF